MTGRTPSAFIVVVLATLVNSAVSQQVFTTEPTDVTVVQGNEVTLECIVSNKEGTLIWTKDGVTIASERTITNGNSRLSVDGDAISGAYNLRFSSTISSDSGSYGCTVGAGGTSGQIGPAQAVLTVGLQQSFITEPSDVTATVGDTLSLSCSVSNKGGSVNWLQGSTVLTSDYTVLNSLGSRLTVQSNGNAGVQYDIQIINSVVSDSGQYKCSVTSTQFGHTAIESTAQVTVSEPLVQRFVEEPQNTQTSVDQSATLFCIVENKEGTLQWFKDNDAISSNRDITNGDSRLSIIGDESVGEHNLRILSAVESDQGDYYCSVTAQGGSDEITSNVAFLDVNSEGQRLGDLPSNVDPKVSSDVTLPCSVVNRNGNVLWLQNGQTISTNREVASNFADRFSIIGNETLDEFYLHIDNVEMDDTGTYTCAVTGTPATSYTVIITVQEATSPDSSSPQCFGPTNEINEGDDIMLICSSQGGDPSAELTWSKNGQEVQSEPVETQIGVKIGVSLTLSYTDQGDVYTCTSHHVTYSEAKTCQIPALQINLIPRISVDVEPNILEITEGSMGTLRCNATGDPAVSGYRWSYNSQPINSTDRRFEHDEGKTVLRVISAEKSMDDAKIWCTASNGIDSQIATASIKIVDKTVAEDDTLSFKFLAAVVALIAGIIVAAIVIAVIIYCVYKKRRDRDEEEDEAPVVQAQEKSAMSSDVGSGRKGLSVPPNGNINTVFGANYFITNGSKKKSLPPVRNGYPNSRQEQVNYDVVYEKSGKKRRGRSRIIKHNVVDPVSDKRVSPPPPYDDYDDYHKNRDSRHRSGERGHDSDRRSRSRSSRRRDKSRDKRDSRKSKHGDNTELDRFDGDDQRRSRRREDEGRDDKRHRDDRRHRSSSETRPRSRRDRDDDRHRAKSSDTRRSKHRDRSYDDDDDDDDRRRSHDRDRGRSYDDRPRSRDRENSYDRDDRRKKERRSRKDRH